MTNTNIPALTAGAIELLRRLIATPSFSREEDGTAALIEAYLRDKGVAPGRLKNNVWACNRHFDPARPTVLLNSHHDTVRPNQGYTRDPFSPDTAEGKLYGLGSNDAGGALVSLLAAFLFFYDREHLPFNLIFAATAEEEISGKDGIELLLGYWAKKTDIGYGMFDGDNPSFGQTSNVKNPMSDYLNEPGTIDCAIVGEPTQMQMAIAEKGLLVLDCETHGKSGHAAREEGENALYKALDDIGWFRTFRFPKVSEFLGPVKMSVTIIQAGSQHNVVPDTCRFTVDVRVNECYTFEEVLSVIRGNVQCEIVPRSMRMRSSIIPADHPLVRAGTALGRAMYGSPTTSDKALMPFPALKMGPGDSARSHSADEFIFLQEIEEGIALYIKLLETFRP